MRVDDKRRDHFLLWIAAAFLTLFVFVHHDAQIALGRLSMSIGQDVVLGRDFANVFTGGTLVLEGRLADIYDLDAYRAHQGRLFDDAVREHNYSYAPVSFLYVWLFALLPYFWSYLLWTAVTGAAFVHAARPYLKDIGLPGWAALLLPASIVNVWAGHYGFVIGALWLSAWRILETRPRLSGMLVGLMVVKPHLAVLMPLVLARRRAWTAFFWAGGTAALAVLASLLAFGLEPWAVYLTETSAYQVSLVDNVGAFFVKMMPTLTPALFQMELAAPAVWTIQIMTAIAAMSALWRFMPADAGEAGLATACATFLVLPYAFIYDMTVVGVAAALLVSRLGPETRPWHWRWLAAYLAFLLPLITFFFGRTGLPLAPAVLALQLTALLAPRRLSFRRAAPGAAAAAHSA